MWRKPLFGAALRAHHRREAGSTQIHTLVVAGHINGFVHAASRVRVGAIDDLVNTEQATEPNPARAHVLAVAVDGSCEMVGADATELAHDSRVLVLQFGQRLFKEL